MTYMLCTDTVGDHCHCFGAMTVIAPLCHVRLKLVSLAVNVKCQLDRDLDLSA